MKTINEKIKKYLVKNLGNRDFILDNKLSKEDGECEIWGFSSLLILVKEWHDGSVHYKPMFNSVK